MLLTETWHLQLSMLWHEERIATCLLLMGRVMGENTMSLSSSRRVGQVISLSEVQESCDNRQLVVLIIWGWWFFVLGLLDGGNVGSSPGNWSDQVGNKKKVNSLDRRGELLTIDWMVVTPQNIFLSRSWNTILVGSQLRWWWWSDGNIAELCYTKCWVRGYSIFSPTDWFLK